MCRASGLHRLLDRLEAGGVLVVTKLDRLGRDTFDVSITITRPAEMGVLALGKEIQYQSPDRHVC
ncbi:MAG: hypothetical protein E5W82_25185 [Mesorhizobium sp.]|nr:MAG: hypothetical protein E5W91_32850 [Mesorhizobium sp.]TIS85395.1 MAG: hypothetical protein E5W89_33255 [Mesorhizobium sp.]TJW07074.1 MAG: hypothetical protein E5W82_25185 [Mesorhizobium sp.]